MADRKNIFLIGRRRMAGDEDQLTEMLAFLWQEAPETLDEWFDALGLPAGAGETDVQTQFVVPSGKRPDIAVFTNGTCTLVESKLKSGFGGTQVPDYLEYLEQREGQGALVLLTERPEHPPVELEERAASAGIRLISQRWHDMSDHLAEPGEESLAGDFVQLLIREGLVKPAPMAAEDWATWNEGFNVLLRVESFLTELDPLIRRMKPNARWRSTSGLTKRWIYRVWRADMVELGFGLAAAGSDSQPHTDPIAFAFVGNQSATDDDAMKAVGVEKGTQYRWFQNEQMKARCGLLYHGWPTLSRPVGEVLSGMTFEEQLRSAANFVRETAEYFRSRGFLPQGLELAGAGAIT